ncbi:hypothetical protein AZI87_11305 [Bdellovibrio bacteriovorus]|uniref:Uncharacterized protein n=1 Tax=Bdellovibrio bacteriovorus TaxID=959 RepID=A0A161PQI6_BDEBC|nr:hypothetical protein [Bdellovibrio bacteriovorus]KYG65150.1 hypothetical protein AZI87_11305 [Bdellovibrio bacteriovorus]
MSTGFVIMGSIAIVVISVLAYAVLAVFFPEWVGITGKVALDAEQSHNEGAQAKAHPMDKF